MALKTGLVAEMAMIAHICRIQTKYGPKAEAAIAQAVSDGKITSTQASNLRAFQASVTDLCTTLKLITGY